MILDFFLDYLITKEKFDDLEQIKWRDENILIEIRK